MNIDHRVVALFVFLMVVCLFTAEGKSSTRSPEQLHFSAEDEGMTHPVAIPSDVLETLKKDEMVRNILESENISADKIPLSWFSASTIHLRTSRQADFVVMAMGPLAGGNVVTFWVFRTTAHGHELVLTAPVHDLVIKNTRGKGYRDIQLISMSAVEVSTVLCRFNGKQYAKFKTTTERIQ